MAAFTEERRGRFLGLIESGRNVEEACAAVGVSRATVSKWAARGRAGDRHAAEFARRFDELRSGGGDERLGEDDLVRLLERAARKGSVQAVKLLLDRFEKEKLANGDDTPVSADPLSEFDELAQRRRRAG